MSPHFLSIIQLRRKIRLPRCAGKDLWSKLGQGATLLGAAEVPLGAGLHPPIPGVAFAVCEGKGANFPRDPGTPKLRMVQWNLKTMRFGDG